MIWIFLGNVYTPEHLSEPLLVELESPFGDHSEGFEVLEQLLVRKSVKDSETLDFVEVVRGTLSDGLFLGATKHGWKC